ncbi:hypothetical protein MPLSOD_270074 [Mesorhizobium sp. SOD10]|nr:hypothetical protein MPLSOD_270074 [Mesorhizobium sp. SOD10]
MLNSRCRRRAIPPNSLSPVFRFYQLISFIVIRFVRPYERIRRKWGGEPPVKILISGRKR